MLLVKTTLKPSKIQGLGLFAYENIKKGTLIWRFDPKFDISISMKSFEIFPEHTKDFITTYAYLSMTTPNTYILCSDDAKYTNHSVNPNILSVIQIKSDEPVGIAAENINKGDELTMDYRTFDLKDSKVNKSDIASYLNK